MPFILLRVWSNSLKSRVKLALAVASARKPTSSTYFMPRNQCFQSLPSNDSGRENLLYNSA